MTDDFLANSLGCLHNEFEVMRMQFKSRRRFNMRTVLAGAQVLSFRFPDGQIHRFKTLILGMSNVGRIGKYESLGWPPATLFAEFTADFLLPEGTLGYARPLSMSGQLIKTHLIHNDRERDRLNRFTHQLVGLEIKNFRRWLAEGYHDNTPTWPHQVQQLEQLITAYASHRVTLERVIARFKAAFASTGTHQNSCEDHYETRAWALSSRFERKLDATFNVAYCLVNVKHVELFMYGDQRDIALHLEPNQPELAYGRPYQQHMFDQLKAQKVQAQQLGLPFYDPDWLANKQRFNQPIWDPQQLDAFNIEDH